MLSKIIVEILCKKENRKERKRSRRERKKDKKQKKRRKQQKREHETNWESDDTIIVEENNVDIEPELLPPLRRTVTPAWKDLFVSLVEKHQ